MHIVRFATHTMENKIHRSHRAHAIVLLLTCDSACVCFNWSLYTAQSSAGSIAHMCHSKTLENWWHPVAVQGQPRHSTTPQSAESSIFLRSALLTITHKGSHGH